MKWSILFNSFVPRRKSNPLLGVLSAVGSVGSSLFSQLAQQEENQKNRDFTLEMWNRQNEYNSPKHQAELLREGGYNPYILSNQGTGFLAQTSPSPSSSPLPAMSNPVAPLASIFQQGLQIQSNIDLQNAKGVQTLVDTAISAYDKLGMEGYRNVMDQISPILSKINLQGSRSDIMFNEQLKNYLSQRYNMDMDSLNKEIEYNLGKKFGEQKIQSNLEKLSYEVSEIVGRLNTMHVQNEALIKQTAADLVVKGAHAFMLKHEGDKFAADAETVNQLRQWLTKTARHTAEIREVDSYFSSARKESNEALVGFATSKEGKEAIRESYRIPLVRNADPLWTALDKTFSDYIKVSSGGSAGSYGFNQSYSGMESNNSLFSW